MPESSVRLQMRPHTVAARGWFLAVAVLLLGVSDLTASGAGGGEESPKEPAEAAAPAEPAGEEASEGTPAAGEDADAAPEESSTEQEEPPEEDQAPPKEEEPEEQPKKKRVIGATAVVKEYQSGLLFRARVDTGAKSCSLNVEEMVIVDESDDWEANVGKVIKFRISNGKDKPQWIESKIQTVVRIKTSDNEERRYKVPLELQWKNVKKRVGVNLNDRARMRYPLLIGRNFLRGEFVVDVDRDSDD